METKLKPCPFCGSKVTVTINDSGCALVHCDGCYAQTIFFNKNGLNVVLGLDRDIRTSVVTQYWNKRVPLNSEVD